MSVSQNWNWNIRCAVQICWCTFGSLAGKLW